MSADNVASSGSANKATGSNVVINVSQPDPVDKDAWLATKGNR